jgi:RHS repeat-associated protein
MSIAANTLKPNQPIRMALPVFSGAMPTASYSIAWYNTVTSEWRTTEASPYQSCALLSNSTVSDVTAMIIVQNADASTVTYLNDGMIYSTETKAKLLFEGQIDARSATTPGADADYVTINYLEHFAANPAGVPGTLSIPVVNQGNSGILTMSKEATFSNKITIKSILINSTNFFPAFTYTEDFVVKPGQVISFKIDRTLDEMKSSKFSGDKISAFYGVNSQSFESMSFSEGVIKGDVGSWNYQFYLKDHLGSTRMALTDDDKIACATMYQPYGTMTDVDGISAGVSDPVRQRFTTKEFDEDGDVNSASGIGLFYFGKRYYDADLGVWNSRDPEEQFWNSYAYAGNGYNPVNSQDVDGQELHLKGSLEQLKALKTIFKEAYGVNIVGTVENTGNGVLNANIQKFEVVDKQFGDLQSQLQDIIDKGYTTVSFNEKAYEGGMGLCLNESFSAGDNQVFLAPDYEKAVKAGKLKHFTTDNKESLFQRYAVLAHELSHAHDWISGYLNRGNIRNVFYRKGTQSGAVNISNKVRKIYNEPLQK